MARGRIGDLDQAIRRVVAQGGRIAISVGYGQQFSAGQIKSSLFSALELDRPVGLCLDQLDGFGGRRDGDIQIAVRDAAAICELPDSSIAAQILDQSIAADVDALFKVRCPPEAKHAELGDAVEQDAVPGSIQAEPTT